MQDETIAKLKELAKRVRKIEQESELDTNERLAPIASDMADLIEDL